MGGLAGPVELGYRIPVTHPVVTEARREGWAVVRRGDPRHDEWIERTAGPTPWPSSPSVHSGR